MNNSGKETPTQWREDFPVEIPRDEYVSRRDFTKFLMLVSGAFFVGQLWILWLNLARQLRGDLPMMEIANASSLPIGGTLTFKYPQEHDPCVLVRTDASNYVAFSQKCTHLSCPVFPRADQKQFHCPCHEGVFDLTTGVPLAGPPRRPLARVKLERKFGKLYAAGMEGAA